MATTGPVGERERVAELDILRGVALLGVLLMNFVAFAGEGWMATEEQLESLPTAQIDWWSYEAIRLFVGDKANTVFATLFGFGFYLQMKRGEGKPGFEARYRRRLFWLLVFGWLNAIFLWVWDILNLYALAGFFLLADSSLVDPDVGHLRHGCGTLQRQASAMAREGPRNTDPEERPSVHRCRSPRAAGGRFVGQLLG